MCFINFTDSVQLSHSSLEFSVNAIDLSQRECFNLSIEFNDADICEYFNCTPRVIQLHMVLSNKTERVNTSNSTVTVQLPSNCTCPSDTPSPTFSTTSTQADVTSTLTQVDVTEIIVAAVVPSLFVVFAIVAIVVVIMVFYRKSSKLKRIDLEG